MPAIPREQIDNIRNNSNIVDIISSYINLEPKGKNFFGICPFHDDHSPSMSVSAEKQIYTCFVCGASGNVFTFIQNYENVDFLEAVKIVADKIGYTLKYEAKTNNPYKIYYEIMDLAKKYYINNIKSPLGENAKKYLVDRKLSDEIINEFGIGVALNNNNLSKYLIGKGYAQKDLLDLGISLNNEEIYDVFKNRITFPINNEKGDIVAFSARIYSGESTNKYINNKENPIFKKGHILFNYDRARKEVNKTKTVIVVEGQMDAIRIYSSGIKNIVATMGTALTKDHIALLKKLNSKIILLMDNDSAGEQSTLVNGEELIKNSLNVEVVRLSGEKDPDDYIIKNGVEAFKNLIQNPISYFDFKLKYLKKDKDLNKSKELAIYVNSVISELNNCNDDILIEVTINNLTKEYGIDKDLIYSKLIKKVPIHTVPIIKKPKPKLNKYMKLCETVLFIMMKDLKYLRRYEKDLGYIPDKQYNQIANDILAFYKINKGFTIADFISYEINNPYYEIVIRIISENEEREPIYEEFEVYLTAISKWIKEEQINKLINELKIETDINRKKEINDLIINLKRENEE